MIVLGGRGGGETEPYGISAAAVGAGAAVVAAYGALVFLRYGLYDDYANGVRPSRDLLTLSISDGRAVGGVLLAAGFGLTEPIDGLGTLRLLGIVLMAVQAVVFAVFLGRLVRSSRAGAVISALAHLTVGSQMIASWGATLWTVPLASLLAGWAGHRFWSANGRLRRMLLPGGALVVSLSIYQPAGMAAIAILVILIVTDTSDLKPLLAVSVRAAAGTGLAIMVYVAVWKVGEAVVPRAGSRGGLTGDVASKFDWLVTTVVPRAADPFSIGPTHSLWPTGMVVLLLVAMSPGVRGRNAVGFLVRSAVALLGPFAAYAPNLAVSESWASARSLYVVYGTMVVLAGLGVLQLVRSIRWGSRLCSQLRGAAGIAVVAAAVLSAGHNVVGLVGATNYVELRAVQARMSAMMTTDPDKIAIVQASWRDSIAERVSYDEFGFPASAAAWAIIPMVEPVLGEWLASERVVVVDSPDSADIPEGAVVIHLSDVLAEVDR